MILNWLLVAAVVVGVLYFFVRPSLNATHESSAVVSKEKSVIKNAQSATFAAGCFWCTEAVFQEYPWVLDAISGYAWGEEVNPSYDDVVAKKTSHREAVRVIYDENQVDYATLIELMLKSIDPTDAWGQFADRGFQYSTAIFTHTDEQKEIAHRVLLENVESYDKPIVTKILPYTTFYEAEEYHQDFYKHSAERYGRYKKGSGRTKLFEESGLNDMQKEALQEAALNQSPYDPTTFVKPSDAFLRETLTSSQYKVTQKDWTEKPFFNKYWDNKAKGLYVDIVSWEPLYSSRDKYKSWTGWPSFVKPVSEDFVTLHEDTQLWSVRTEVRSAIADSHLWHVFDDGPDDRGGKRRCMNSASMDFIPLQEMEERWYWEWIESVE